MTAFVWFPAHCLLAPISQAMYENTRRFKTKKSQFNSRNTYFLKEEAIPKRHDVHSPLE